MLRFSWFRRIVSALLLVMLSAVTFQRHPIRMGGFVEPDFPFITSTVDAGGLGAGWPARNIAIRGVVIQLGNGAYATFDPDLLRMSVGWYGDFLSLTSMAHISYEEPGNKANDIPRVLGTPILATGLYPGWQGEKPAFSDPRPAGYNPQEVGRGPLPDRLGRWNGLYLAGQQVVLTYSVLGTDVAEQPGSIRVGDEVGIVRTFRIGASEEVLTLVVAEVNDGVAVDIRQDRVYLRRRAARLTGAGLAGQADGLTWEVLEHRYITLRVSPSEAPREFSVVVWTGNLKGQDAFGKMLHKQPELVDFKKGGPVRWREHVMTSGRIADDTSAYVLDEIALPVPNPWDRKVRPAAIDFFQDGRAAISTFDGDVWIVSGIDRDLQDVSWQRFASGLYEPLSIAVVDDVVYTYGREGITRLYDLNGDGEADFYENFSSGGVQTIESREYPMGMAPSPDGGFFLAKGGALSNGPQTSEAIMPGFRSGGIHSGTVLKVSADGQVSTYATGLREPFLGVHLRTGVVTASDQQGNFVPSTPIYVIREGDYFGVPATAHGASLEEITPPLTWIPHEVDQSGAGQVWIASDRMGSLSGSLIHLSYGRPGLFRVYVDSSQTVWQGAVVALPGAFKVPALKGQVSPVDGQLYVTGFQIWGSKAKDIGGLVRLRYTGKPSTLPVDVRAGAQGVVLRFEQALDPAVAGNPRNYGVERWNYLRTEKYGSGHFKPDGSPGQEMLPVVAAHLSRDGRAVLLVLPDVQKVMQMGVAYDIATANGQRIKDTAYLTLNTVAPLDLNAMGFDAIDVEQVAASAELHETAESDVKPTAVLGEALYVRLGCMACHSTDGSLDGKAGPSFKDAFGTMRTFTDGSTSRMDEAYIRRSILEPSSQIVEGYHEEMPAYLGVLSDTEIESITLFIKSLGKQ